MERRGTFFERTFRGRILVLSSRVVNDRMGKTDRAQKEDSQCRHCRSCPLPSGRSPLNRGDLHETRGRGVEQDLPVEL